MTLSRGGHMELCYVLARLRVEIIIHGHQYTRKFNVINSYN
jgi:hypothetical protein